MTAMRKDKRTGQDLPLGEGLWKRAEKNQQRKIDSLAQGPGALRLLDGSHNWCERAVLAKELVQTQSRKMAGSGYRHCPCDSLCL